jgi:hypothetical protein
MSIFDCEQCDMQENQEVEVETEAEEEKEAPLPLPEIPWLETWA